VSPIILAEWSEGTVAESRRDLDVGRARSMTDRDGRAGRTLGQTTFL
jgi:hypothetical protein